MHDMMLSGRQVVQVCVNVCGGHDSCLSLALEYDQNMDTCTRPPPQRRIPEAHKHLPTPQVDKRSPTPQFMAWTSTTTSYSQVHNGAGVLSASLQLVNLQVMGDDI